MTATTFSCFTVFLLLWWYEASASESGLRVVRENHQFQTRQAAVLIQPRIIGGSNAIPGQYPFYVQWGGCGASLIYPDIILSAAHCNIQTQNSVRVGAYNSAGNWNGDGSVFKSITNRSVHPNYDPTTVHYDFLVMKLKTNATQTPIQLNSNPNNPVAGQNITVIGFGDTSLFAGSTPTILQVVTVNYVDQAVCSSTYGSIDSTIELCAGVPEGGKDACAGDSGGPIFDTQGNQVGLSSFGFKCGQAGFPGVYARVSGAIDWINQQICSMSAYPPPSCFAGLPTRAPQPSPPPTPSPTCPKKTLPPTAKPTLSPTAKPTLIPTSTPTAKPTAKPTTAKPTAKPTLIPTIKPSVTSKARVQTTGKPLNLHSEND